MTFSKQYDFPIFWLRADLIKVIPKPYIYIYVAVEPYLFCCDHRSQRDDRSYGTATITTIMTHVMLENYNKHCTFTHVFTFIRPVMAVNVFVAKTVMGNTLQTICTFNVIIIETSLLWNIKNKPWIVIVMYSLEKFKDTRRVILWHKFKFQNSSGKGNDVMTTSTCKNKNKIKEDVHDMYDILPIQSYPIYYPVLTLTAVSFLYRSILYTILY